MAPRSSQTFSSPELQVHRIDQPHHRKPESPELIKSNDANLLQTLLKKVRVIESIVTKNDRRLVENDRRLTRLEVTVNKTFLVLGDVSNAINTRAIMGNTLPSEVKPPKGFRAPQLPIKRLRDLVFVNDHLANKDFLNYLVSSKFVVFGHSTFYSIVGLFTIFSVGLLREGILLLQQLNRHSHHDLVLATVHRC